MLPLGSVFGRKRVPRPLPEQHSSYSLRQHHSSCLCKQRRGDEVGPSVCPTVENPYQMYQQTGYSQSPTHSRPAECGNRHAIQARPDYSNRVVAPSRGRPGNMQQVAPTSNRPLCDKVQVTLKAPSLIGPCVWSEHCATIWTGPQTSGKIRS